MRKTRAVVFLLGATLCLAGLTGCGGTEPAGNEDSPSGEPSKTLKETASARHSLDACETLAQIEQTLMVGDPNDSAARAELVAALEGLAPAFEPYDSAEGATKLADWVAQPRERRLDLTGQDEALPTGIRWSAKQCQVDYAGYLPDDALDALADDLWAGLNADWFYAARPEDDPSHPLHETCLASDAYQEYLRSIEAGEVKADYVYLRMLLTDLLPYVEADGDDGVIESIERLIEAIDVVQAGGTGQATQEDLDQPVLWGATKGCSLS